MKQAKTYFETIPVTAVKTIAVEHPGNNGRGDHKPENDVSTRESWREIAQRVQAEPDPNRMIALVQELINRYDQEKLRNGQSVGSDIAS